MSTIWFSDESKEIFVTLAPTHLTINKFGSQFFETSKQVMLGYDEAKQIIIIKPLSKDEIIRGDIPEHSRYNISMNVSYARITNKAFITKVTDVFGLNLKDGVVKLTAYWRTKNGTLEISVKEVA